MTKEKAAAILSTHAEQSCGLPCDRRRQTKKASAAYEEYGASRLESTGRPTTTVKSSA